MKFIKAHWRKIAAALILCVIAAVLVVNYQTKSSKETFSPTEQNNENNEITLTILGNVASPGSYKIEKGTSIRDNMHLFGGFTADADVSNIDIKSPLTKDTKVTVKKRTGTDNNNYDSLYELPK